MQEDVYTKYTVQYTYVSTYNVHKSIGLWISKRLFLSERKGKNQFIDLATGEKEQNLDN